ncbi:MULTISPECIES: transporter substrate-binding domain-containing protein [unclassified Pseudomonas]|jgi:polar amino acid transport system substrate-binding protein|uniref:ABC transporter substrate-binding protein n=1 Tax=unclassified Pseudomonas TaxID=196821 RepID=UPI000D6AB54E|nr:MULTISPECIES: transporter substrate-binding domain-containing protein [unclassified Pseudomonas]AXP03008.1 amino acid ABC transporter substrate-binding protein [Pseudomonas fluorescens]PWJ29660.1 polar amino acid transport system substrate-binding protein [Pseudomonas sp. 43mfcvi1.1]WLH65622.1 transporter substrate-binding domain-containing protein [Pseudomonas sp. FP2300]SSB99518.1 polar amino acid transport system substrate-binding protein [Pseudomonas sp. 43mfcvi1.1]
MKNPALAVALSVVLTPLLIAPAHADKLDDIIGSGKLRCAVTLDFPPMGFRDESNKPAGFDVDYCHDLAKVLGVDAEVVETPFSDRIPALLSGRADVIVASTSDTLERAKTVGLTVPYFAFQMVVLTRDNTGINSYADLKGKNLGNTSSTYEAIALEKDQKSWGSGSFRAYQSQNDTLLAVAQGHIDATVVTNTVAAATIKSGKYKGLKIAGDAPYVIDYVSLGAKRNEYGLLNYLNLFVNQQVRTGRYKELFVKWVGTDIPPANLTVPQVYY